MWTSEQLRVLSEAIASGVQTVRYADRTVTYHSLKEMLDLRDRMVRELDAQDPQPLRRRPIAGLAGFHRG